MTVDVIIRICAMCLIQKFPGLKSWKRNEKSAISRKYSVWKVGHQPNIFRLKSRPSAENIPFEKSAIGRKYSVWKVGFPPKIFRLKSRFSAENIPFEIMKTTNTARPAIERLHNEWMITEKSHDYYRLIFVMYMPIIENLSKLNWSKIRTFLSYNDNS